MARASGGRPPAQAAALRASAWAAAGSTAKARQRRRRGLMVMVRGFASGGRRVVLASHEVTAPAGAETTPPCVASSAVFARGVRVFQVDRPGAPPHKAALDA